MSAHVLDRILASPNVSHVLHSLPPWMRPELEATRAAIRQAAQAYEDLPAAEDGTTETATRAIAPCSPQEITTCEAGVLLGLTDRRMRQLAAGGMGRRAGGRWLLDRSAVLAYGERRRSAHGDL